MCNSADNQDKGINRKPMCVHTTGPCPFSTLSGCWPQVLAHNFPGIELEYKVPTLRHPQWAPAPGTLNNTTVRASADGVSAHQGTHRVWTPFCTQQ